MLPEPDTTDGWTWRFGAGCIEVRSVATGFMLTTPELEEPLLLPGTGPASLAMALGTRPVVARLVHPLVVPAQGTVNLRLAWPLIIDVRWAEKTVETWRDGMRRTLLGAVTEGEVVDAIRTEVLADGATTAPGFAELHVEVVNPLPEASRTRRIAFPEEGLTLWREGTTLHAGTVQVRIQSSEHGEARCMRPEPPEGAQVLRAGNRLLDGSEPAPTRWWLQGSRRSMGFQV